MGQARGGPRRWLQRRLRVRIERWIANSADQIVFAAQSLLALDRRRDPGRQAGALGPATDNAPRVRATRSGGPPSTRDDA